MCNQNRPESEVDRYLSPGVWAHRCEVGHSRRDAVGRSMMVIDASLPGLLAVAGPDRAPGGYNSLAE
jgi:hypothetical protein